MLLEATDAGSDATVLFDGAVAEVDGGAITDADLDAPVDTPRYGVVTIQVF